MIDETRFLLNAAAAPASEPYGAARSAVLGEAGFDAAMREVSGWPGYAPTPVWRLPGLGARIRAGRGIGHVCALPVNCACSPS